MRPEHPIAAKLAAAPLRIALLAHSTNPRGGVVHAVELGDALHDLGHHVALHAPDLHGRGLFRQTRCEFRAVPAAPCGNKLADLVRQRIADYVAWFENPTTPAYDIYHAQDSISANALADLTERGLIPGFCRTVHHLDEFDDPQLMFWQTRGFTAAAQVFCVSRLWRDNLYRDYGVTAKLVTNGVDTVRFTACPDASDDSLRARLRLGSGPILLAVGGIEPRKNTLATLEAFTRFRRHHPEAQLVIAGGVSLLDHSAYRQAFDEAVRSSGLSAALGSLILLGKVDDADVPALFRCASVLVFPSLREGFGLVVLEAMACGTPVVVSKIAPFTEHLHEGSCAWVDPSDPASIAAGAAYACEPENACRLRLAGQALSSEFTWTKSASAHLEHYRSHRGLLSETHHA